MINSIEQLKNIDIEQLAAAIEQDAGEQIPELRESLQDVKDGNYQVAQFKNKRGRPVGSKAKNTKLIATFRLDPDVLQQLRASGKGWQTRVNAFLRSAIDEGKFPNLTSSLS